MKVRLIDYIGYKPVFDLYYILSKMDNSKAINLKNDLLKRIPVINNEEYQQLYSKL